MQSLRWRRPIARALVVVGSLARLTMLRLATSKGREASLESNIRLLKAELRIKDARLRRVPLESRPRYSPSERLEILLLRAGWGWSAAETARRFLLTAVTIANWSKRLDDEGEDALVRVPVPVNRFPDFVRVVVRQLRASFPALGHLRAAQMLARAGLAISVASVARIHRQKPSPKGPSTSKQAIASTRPRRIRAKRPHDVWHVDLTVMPRLGGFWIPWLPFAMNPRWPFAYWVGVVLDHHTRMVLAKAVYKKAPTAVEICRLLSKAERSAGRAPRAIITDQGVQFRARYRRWCKRHGVRPRFGAVGQHGSIAIVERFIRSMKEECLRTIRFALSPAQIELELDAYLIWYHHHRPHQGLGGQTPLEVLRASKHRAKKPKPRKRKRKRLRPMKLRLSYVEGRPHLPIVRLRRAA